MHRTVRSALVPLAAAALVAAFAGCSGDDDEATPRTPTETTPTAVAGTGADTTERSASDFCSSLGPSGVEDLLGGSTPDLTATDTSCTWSERAGDEQRHLEVTMTPYPDAAEAQSSVTGDVTPAPGLDSFAASAVTFDGDRGEVQVSTGPAVIAVSASGPGLTEARLADATVAMLQG